MPFAIRLAKSGELRVFVLGINFRSAAGVRVGGGVPRGHPLAVTPPANHQMRLFRLKRHALGAQPTHSDGGLGGGSREPQDPLYN